MKLQKFSRKGNYRYKCPPPFENCRVHHYTDKHGRDQVFIYGLDPLRPMHMNRLRYNACIILGRFLESNEQAIARNGDFTNASIFNTLIQPLRKPKKSGRKLSPREQRTCSNSRCGKTYEVLKSKKTKYCSVECFDDHQRNGGPYCKNCKNKFIPTKGFSSYCSMLCRSQGLSNRRKIPQNQKEFF